MYCQCYCCVPRPCYFVYHFAYTCTCSHLINYVVTYTESVVLYNSAQYYGSWLYTDNYYYSCSSNSSSLTGCSKYSAPSSSYCNSYDQVGLWCMTLPQTGKHMYILNVCITYSTFLPTCILITIIIQLALMGLFAWWEEHHPMKAK